MKGLKVVLPSAVADPTGLRKLEHYYGIEFTRGASNGGGDNGYHKMIGDESLLREMRFHNQIKIANVKNAETKSYINQVNWNKNEDGSNAIIDGSDGSDVMQVHTKGVYAIIGGTNALYERYIVSDQPFSYDGDEAKYYPAYGETPDFATLHEGVLRSIRNDNVPGTANAGIGTEHTNTNFGNANAGGFPKTQLSRVRYEQYARAKNPDKASNLPYMHLTHQEIDLTAAFMFIEFRTKQLNSILGHGISSNASPTAATWGKVSGFRLTADNGATYTYKHFAETFFPDGGQTSKDMWTILNGYCPLLKIFEAQLAVSNGDTLEAVTDSDGNPVQGLSKGVMTGIWTKAFSFKVNGSLIAGGESKTYKVDVVFRVPVWRGRTRLWGNIWQCVSGYEVVRYADEEGKTHNLLYRAPSIEAITSDSDETQKTSAGQYAIERDYELVGEAPVITSGAWLWGSDMLSHKGITTPVISKTGGSISTHESAVTYISPAPVGKYERRAVFLGGIANGSYCVLRYAHCNYAPSNSHTSIGSGFRVNLND